MADVISAGTSKPTNLAITRNDEDMTLTWGIPLNLVDNSFKGKKITFIDVWWSFNASKNMSKRWTEVRYPGTAIADKLWIRDLGTSARNHTQAFDRDDYAPITPGRYLNSVTGWVQVNGAEVKTTYSFKKPIAGRWDDPEFDGTENTVSCTFTCGEDGWTADSYDRERYDTHWQVSRKDNCTPWYKNETLLDEDAVTNDSFTVDSGEIEGADSLAYNQWIDIHFRAVSRGLAGDSPEAHVLYTIAHPPKASIQSISVDTDHSLIAVWMSVNANAYHPVDTVELERLADTTIWTASMASQANGWTTVAESTDAECSGLFDALNASSTPSTGKYTWYRVKTTRCGYTQYSDPVRAKKLEQKSPVSNDTVKIYSVTPQADGTSLRVVLGWNWTGDDSNGTEISWSQYEDAWQSTTAPNVYDLDDSRRDASSQVPNMAASSVLVIRELEEGTPYYIRARRYQDNGDNRIYSERVCSAPSGSYPISPKNETTAVRLTGPQYVLRGDGATLTWTYDSEADQKSWHLYRQWTVTNNGTTTTEREIVASGEDQSGSAVVTAAQMGNGDSASFVVGVSTGGEWSESEPFTTIISDPPELELDTVGTLTAQPFGFSFACDMSNADIIAKVTSSGTATGTPDGELVQAEGDVIWSARFTPSYTLGEDELYHAEMALPNGMPFIDGTLYVVEIAAVDNVTGFTSEACADMFSVDWSHKASPPKSTSTVTPDAANRTTTVHPIAPTGAAQTDVYDLYRVTNDSVDLIAEGQLFGVDATDRFAPFSKDMTLTYRIATRTNDGSVEWADFEYDMPVGVMRFDWGDGESVELPYNIALQDSYEKNYEAHQHLDGSVSGHWNPGFHKAGSYSTDLIKITDADEAKAVREMATYPGPVFVRTPDGGAFEANVTLGIDTQYSSGAVGISLNVEGTSLSDAFRLAPDDFTEEE